MSDDIMSNYKSSEILHNTLLHENQGNVKNKTLALHMITKVGTKNKNT